VRRQPGQRVWVYVSEGGQEGAWPELEVQEEWEQEQGVQKVDVTSQRLVLLNLSFFFLAA
jgi:hypothetical protein